LELYWEFFGKGDDVDKLKTANFEEPQFAVWAFVMSNLLRAFPRGTVAPENNNASDCKE